MAPDNDDASVLRVIVTKYTISKSEKELGVLVVGDEIDLEDLEEDSGHDDRPNGGSSRDHIGVRCNDALHM